MNFASNFLLLSALFLLFSCTKESLDIQPKEETPEVTTEVPTLVNCEEDFFNVAAGESFVINCILDLNKESINLPNGVTLISENGGDIINGTINFGSGSKIDGNLMSSSLNLLGDVKLIDDEFEFIPSRWDNIVEGQTTSDIALKNTVELEKLFFLTKDLGATTFNIDKFDAFFEVTKVTSTTSDQNFRSSKEGVNLPSDFHLKMTSNTYLRMFPAEIDVFRGTVLAIREVENVRITGGNILGDRDLRSYVADPGEQGTHLLQIHSGRNITIENMNFENGSSGGITVFSIGFSFNSNYNPSTGLKFLNNTFKNNRRMAIAFTDGRDALIEGNTFINTGQPSTNSDGGNVGYAINIEPVRKREADGEVKEFQRAFNIEVRNNIEKNSRIGFITVIGENITITNNKVETRIAHAFASNVKIIGNKLTAPQGSDQKFAIFSAGDQSLFVFDNEIANNEISGYGVAISLQTFGVKVHDNIIKNCATGIQIAKTDTAEIFKNDISVSNLGILSNLTYADNININNNKINAGGFHIKLTKLNQETDQKNYSVEINNNNFTTSKKVSLFFANGVTINQNKIMGAIEIIDSTNINVSSNEITPNESDGIRLTGNHNSVLIENNIVSEPTGSERFVCLNNDSNTPNEVSISNNTCN